MAIQLSVEVRNGRLDSIETTMGASPKIQFRTGTQPANTAEAAAGTLLREFTLPSDFFSDAAAGVKSLLGSWTDSSAGTAGVIGHFRILNNAGTLCHMHGSVSASGGGGDMIVSNTNLAQSQPVTVESFNMTDGNA